MRTGFVGVAQCHLWNTAAMSLSLVKDYGSEGSPGEEEEEEEGTPGPGTLKKLATIQADVNLAPAVINKVSSFLLCPISSNQQ